MEFLSDYGLFLAKTVTFVAAALLIVSAILGASHRKEHDDDDEGTLEISRLNDKLKAVKTSLESAMVSKADRKQWEKAQKKQAKAEAKKTDKKATAEKSADGASSQRIFVIDFEGDIKASATEQLRRSITAILSVANTATDRVVVRLESPGGMVHAYGLASAQLDRLRSAGLPLTACVDKVAASGGYMMACVADHIVASPFAVIGSIGVVAQLPNFHRLLKKHDVDYEVLTAGEYKRTLTVFGENTDKGREKFQSDLEDTHDLFKDYVSQRRPALDIEKVANGDIWFGQRALDVGLVDELKTSDEFLNAACETAEVLQIRIARKKSLPEKLGLSVAVGIEKSVWRFIDQIRQSRWLS